MFLDFRDIRQTGIRIFSQQLNNTVSANFKWEEKKLTWLTKLAASSVINELSTKTGSSHLICSAK
jgi:hypothetical protein